MTHVTSPDPPFFVLQNLEEDDGEDEARPLAESLLLAIADLLFCPDFTVQSCKRSSPVSPTGSVLDILMFIWTKHQPNLRIYLFPKRIHVRALA